MAKNDNLTDFMVDLADGIRAKKGTTEPINPQDFRKEIESISGGESDIEYIDVSSVDNDTQRQLWDIALEVKIEADDDSLEYFGLMSMMQVTTDYVGLRRTRAISINTKSPIRIKIGDNEITDWNTLLSMLPIDFAALPRLTKEEFYTIEKPKYKAGVYIQHIDGSLYLEEEWVSNGFSNDDANGVYVSNGTHAFIVAKDSLGSIPWSSKPNVLVDEVTTTDDYEIAMRYNNGVEDTAKIAAFDPDSAAAACANYTFPNGQKGYLPSLAEVRMMLDCNECLELIGGTPIDEYGTYYWSSIQVDAERALTARIGMHDFMSYDKSDRHGCRPVCAYIENK